MALRKFIVLIVLTQPITLIASPPPVDVPLEYWGYNFIDRCETQGLVSAPELRCLPVSRSVFIQWIDQIDDHLQQSPDSFSATEWDQFEQLKGDFIGKNTLTGKDERHLWSYSEPTGTLFFDAIVNETIILNRGDSFEPDRELSETTLGGQLRGHLGQEMGFFVDARNIITRGEDNVQDKDEQFDVSQGMPVVVSGSNLVSDRAVAYVVFSKPWLRIKLGQDQVNWGPGYNGGLMLSQNSPPASLVQLQTRFKRFSFTYVHGFLNSSFGSKYIAAHRIDLSISRTLHIGATESVIYGGRDVEPLYLNPLMPYHVAEHHLGDLDNNTLGLDVTWIPVPSLKVYTELFIDDMTSTKNLLHYFGNKFGLLTGAHWTHPLGLKDMDTRLEYTRLDPYVYTHWDSLNVYTHYNRFLGHWLGPNADAILLQLGYQLNRDVRIEYLLQQFRYGKERDLYTSRPAEGEEKPFLQGPIEKKTRWGFSLSDQLFRDVTISVTYSHLKTVNKNHQPGNETTDHLAWFEVLINY